MPLIQVRVIKDVFSGEQKRQIISKLTDAMVSIEGENMRNVTWCVVEEVESGDWGIGGNALTTADVHALARGKAARRRGFASPSAAPGPLMVVRGTFLRISPSRSWSCICIAACRTLDNGAVRWTT